MQPPCSRHKIIKGEIIVRMTVLFHYKLFFSDYADDGENKLKAILTNLIIAKKIWTIMGFSSTWHWSVNLAFARAATLKVR